MTPAAARRRSIVARWRVCVAVLALAQQDKAAMAWPACQAWAEDELLAALRELNHTVRYEA